MWSEGKDDTEDKDISNESVKEIKFEQYVIKWFDITWTCVTVPIEASTTGWIGESKGSREDSQCQAVLWAQWNPSILRKQAKSTKDIRKNLTCWKNIQKCLNLVNWESLLNV